MIYNMCSISIHVFLNEHCTINIPFKKQILEKLHKYEKLKESNFHAWFDRHVHGSLNFVLIYAICTFVQIIYRNMI